MQELILRKTEQFVIQNLTVFSAVAILGSRQCGKSTLVKMMSEKIKTTIIIRFIRT